MKPQTRRHRKSPAEASWEPTVQEAAACVSTHTCVCVYVCARVQVHVADCGITDVQHSHTAREQICVHLAWTQLKTQLCWKQPAFLFFSKFLNSKFPSGWLMENWISAIIGASCLLQSNPKILGPLQVWPSPLEALSISTGDHLFQLG